MNKRGISAVVATVLIILITVAGVTIIWGAIIPMIRDNLDFSALEGRVYVVTSGGYTFYDASAGLAKVQVKRDMDDGVMNRIKIDFSIDGNSVSSSVVAPDSGNTKVYVFDLSGYGEPDSVSVAPIFVSGSGKEKIGSVTSNVDVGTGVIAGTIPRAEQYKPDREYYGDRVELAKGLVAYYDFEGDVLDGSGNVNDGSIGGTVSYVSGAFGQAASFDGSSSYVNIGSDSSLDMSPFDVMTYSVWINPSSYPSNPDVNIGIAEVLRQEGNFFLSYRGDVGTYWQVGIFQDSPLSSAVAPKVDKSLVPIGSWTNIALVANGTDVKAYINGEWQESVGYYGTLGGIISDTIIGAYKDKANRFFSGSIDEVRIYNRPLSDEEISLIAAGV